MKVCSCPHWIPPQIANAREGIDRIEGLLNKDLLCTHVATEIGLICHQIEAISESGEDLRRIVEKVVSVGSAKIPLAVSKVDFDQFASLIVGDFPNSQFAKYFNQKREIFFPTYLDALSDLGHTNLHQHLLHMRVLHNQHSRQTEIEKMSFLQVSQVVLETRNAIMQKVERSIPDSCNQVLFLVGHSGTGKSTSFCFLTGEKMRLREDFTYVTFGKKEALIGESYTSGTFIPNVEVTKEGAIVDFPAFAHSHGSLVDLGIECAFRALVKKYRPQVLVIESILSRERGYETAANLGRWLSRVLENKENCFLGITNYSRNVDFRQMRVVRNEPLAEELRLQIEIKEKEILKQIGLTKFFRFIDLEYPETLAQCRHVLFDHRDFVRGNQHLTLDPCHTYLISGMFENNLEKKLMTNADPTQMQDLTAFEQKVLDTSLMNTIAPPEIGQFLHLPEIDPNLVREFDKKIAHDFFNIYKKALISLLDKDLIDKIINEIEKTISTGKVKNLKDQWVQLQKFIMLFTGIVIPCNPSHAENGWREIQRIYQTKIEEALREKVGVSPRARAGIHYAILKLVESNILKQGLEEALDLGCKALSAMQQNLRRLKGLEVLIRESDEIDQVFRTIPISLVSSEDLNESIRKRINFVRKIYGPEDWDERVGSLTAQIKDPGPTFWMSACAYSFIEPGLTRICQKVSGTQKGRGKLFFRKKFTLEQVKAILTAYSRASAFIKSAPSPLLLVSEADQKAIKALAKDISQSLTVESKKELEANEIEQLSQMVQWLIDLKSIEDIRLFVWMLIEAKRDDLINQNIFLMAIRQNSDGAPKIEVLGLEDMPDLKDEFEETHSKHLRLSRALFTAAFLKRME